MMGVDFSYGLLLKGFFKSAITVVFFIFFISTTQGVTREILHSLKRQLYLEPKINAKCYEEKNN